MGENNLKRFCTKCGKEFELGQKFCIKCGTPIVYDQNIPVQKEETDFVSSPETETTSQNDTAGEENEQQYLVKCAKCKQVYDRRYPHTCKADNISSSDSFFKKIVPGRTLSKYPDINNLKQTVNSWLFFVLLIVYCIYAIAMLISAFSSRSGLFDSFNNIMRIFNGDNYYMTFESIAYNMLGLEGIMSVMNGITILVKLIKLIPIGIVAYGILEFYLSCIDEKRNGVSTKGLRLIQTLYKILMIVEIVMCALTVIFAIICAAVLIPRIDEYAFFPIGCFVLFAAIYGVNIIYYKKIIETIMMVRKTVKEKGYAVPTRISKFVIVWHFIICAGNIFNIAFSNNVFASLMNLTVLILINILFIQFNKSRELAESPYAVVDPENDLNY